MCTNLEEKKIININNPKAEIRKIKRIEKEIALTNCFYKEMAHNK